MADKYKIKEVNVTLANGITVKVEIEKIENLKDLIDDLKCIGLLDLNVKPESAALVRPLEIFISN
jgi:hypothetical protein